MRIWVGKEQEGQYKGAQTLFVESPIINKSVLDKVISLLHCCDKYKVTQLYFGAGKIGITRFDPDTKPIFCELGKKYLLSIEQPITMLNVIPKSTFRNIIGTVDTVELPNTVKLDSGKKVYCQALDTFITTDISGVANGIYELTDKILYKED